MQENAPIIAAPDAQVTEKLVAPVEKSTKKTTAKKPCAKKGKKEGFVRFGFGEDLPYYLL